MKCSLKPVLVQSDIFLIFNKNTIAFYPLETHWILKIGMDPGGWR